MTLERAILAIGPLDSAPAIEQRAFSPGDDFEVMGEPKRIDWLAVHHEPGQTFDRFVAGRYNRPDAERGKIYLRCIGEFNDVQQARLEWARRYAAAFFQMEVVFDDAVTFEGAPVTHRNNPHSNHIQYRTDGIVRWLEGSLPADAYCLLGATMEDLYPNEQWNFVFGWATFRRRVGVHSFARYDPTFFGNDHAEADELLVLARGCKVVVHEIAHMFGLGHCIYFKCPMNGFNHMTECDDRPMHLCPVCLRKLHYAIGFDIAARYGELQAFFADIGFEQEAQWLRDRKQVLEQ
jgi:archaemetzincin